MGLGVDRRIRVERVVEPVGPRRARHELRDPWAPAPLVANGLKPDSAYSWAASRFIGTFQRSAALAIGSWKRGGTKSAGHA